MGASRRTGQVIRQGASKFMVRVFAGRDRKGKRRYVSQIVNGTKKDADAVLSAMLTQRDKGERIEAPRRQELNRISLDDFLDDWIQELQATSSLKERTFLTYRYTAQRYIRPLLGKKQLRYLTSKDVAQMMTDLTAKGISPRLTRNTRAVLRTALQAAKSKGLIDENPALGGKIVKDALPRLEDKEMVTLPSDLRQDFLKAIEQEPFRAFFIVMLYGGFRPAEALALRWQDFDGETLNVRRVLIDNVTGRVPYFASPKTKRSARSVPMPSVAVEALARHRREKEAGGYSQSDLIFSTVGGMPLRQRTVRDALQRVTSRHKLPDLTLYSLRHTHATWLLEQGVDLTVVRDRLGHSTIQQTADTYAHVTRRHQNLALDALTRLG